MPRDLIDLCFELGTAFAANNIPATLSGGAAAYYYSNGIVASDDADFVIGIGAGDEAIRVLESLGYARLAASGRVFARGQEIFTVELVSEPLAVLSEVVRETVTVTKGEQSFKTLTSTDCVRDRLAQYFAWGSGDALKSAIRVTVAQRGRVNMSAIEEWAKREAEGPYKNILERHRIFARRVEEGLRGHTLS